MLIGDRLEMLIMAILPAKLYRWIHGQNCGCTARKRFLNKWHRKWRQYWYDRRNA